MLQTARRVGGTAAAVVLGPTAVVLAGGSAYVMSEHGPLGLQRSVKFWATLAPTVVEWQFLRAQAWALGPQRFDLDAEKKAFHQRTAAKSLGILLSLGGIYVKLGQLVGTIGVALRRHLKDQDMVGTIVKACENLKNVRFDTGQYHG